VVALRHLLLHPSDSEGAFQAALDWLHSLLPPTAAAEEEEEKKNEESNTNSSDSGSGDSDGKAVRMESEASVVSNEGGSSRIQIDPEDVKEVLNWLELAKNDENVRESSVN
jgi:hypothetical protein